MNRPTTESVRQGVDELRFFPRAQRELVRNRYLYLMLVPVILFYVIFHYAPMYGLIIAFKDYIPTQGMWKSPWVGFRHFVSFFTSVYAWRLIRNVILINIYNLVFQFPAPIILALLLNEIRITSYRRVVQTITYLPHFVSIVIIVGLMMDFLSREGVVNRLILAVTSEPIPFFTDPRWFRTLYVSSNIWQTTGWSSIIYLAALTSINPELYEAAAADGAGRWRQVWNISLPGLLPTTVILFIMRMGRMMTVGFEKILLMYNALTYETADVISTFVYRRGLIMADFSYSTAVGFVNAIINFTLLVAVNRLARRVGDTSLW
jgi:putative aldouronate transport system permease protein